MYSIILYVYIMLRCYIEKKKKTLTTGRVCACPRVGASVAASVFRPDQYRADITRVGERGTIRRQGYTSVDRGRRRGTSYKIETTSISKKLHTGLDYEILLISCFVVKGRKTSEMIVKTYDDVFSMLRSL